MVSIQSFHVFILQISENLQSNPLVTIQCFHYFFCPCQKQIQTFTNDQKSPVNVEKMGKKSGYFLDYAFFFELVPRNNGDPASCFLVLFSPLIFYTALCVLPFYTTSVARVISSYPDREGIH